MTTEELNDLAHEIAEDDSKSLIYCMTVTTNDGEANWHDLVSCKADEPGAEALERAVCYLDATGILHRSKTNPSFVGWDGDGLNDEPA